MSHEARSNEDAMGEQLHAANLEMLRLEAESKRLRAALQIVQTEARQQGYDKVLYVATRALNKENL